VIIHAKKRIDALFVILRHLTGGIDLSAEWAGFTTVGQCEIDDYATKVLEKNFPGAERWRDIRDVTVESFRERTGINAGELTLLSGGLPCQPETNEVRLCLAGKRKASADERDLWGEFARIIREIRPLWVVAENVPALLTSESGRYFGRILRDLDEMGYNVGWCCYPAAWVGAIHRRNRLFIIAYSNGERRHIDETLKQKEFAGVFTSVIPTEFEQNAAHNILPVLSWHELEPNIGVYRNDDGISKGVDRHRCLGNAVCPQQIYPILAGIAEIELKKLE